MPQPSHTEPLQAGKNLVSFDDTQIAFGNRSNAELLKMNLLFSTMNNNFLVKTGAKFMQCAFDLGLPLAETIVKNTLFEHFCGGENITTCEKTIQQLEDVGVGTILDYSVEGAKSTAGFDLTKAEIIRTIERAKGSSSIPFCVFKITGIGHSYILEKFRAQKHYDDTNEEDRSSWENLYQRVDAICKAAFEHDVRIFIDGEETWLQDAIDFFAYEMMKKYNQEKVIVYNTYQMYTTDRLEKLKKAYQEALDKGYHLGAKLVRGAYMEKESERALEKNYPDPIQPSKEACDKDYDLGIAFCAEHYERIALCAGTHNEDSCYKLVGLMEQMGIDKQHKNFFFAQLYGMSDNLSNNLSAAGYNVCKYVPYGPVKAVMPYLIRRAEENTSIAGQSSREYRLIQKELQRRKTSRA